MTLASRWSDERIAAINDYGPDAEEFSDAVALNLATQTEHRDGIKFFIIISTPSSYLTLDYRQDMRDRLCAFVDRANEVFDISLYEGSGFGQFLILGRVPTDAFYAITDDLVVPIREAGIMGVMQSRTYTHVSAAEDYMLVQDELPTESLSKKNHVSLEEHLAQDESSTLEVKGSAFMDLDPWLREGKKARPSEGGVFQVLKAVVGLLNADGGTVVVGAIERHRYEGSEAAANLPVRGPYAICGLERDYGRDGWDGFQRRLAHAINERIAPTPHGQVDLKRATVEQMDLCVISVRPRRSEPREWFYLQPKGDAAARFYVRHGNATRELRGPEADKYKLGRQ